MFLSPPAPGHPAESRDAYREIYAGLAQMTQAPPASQHSYVDYVGTKVTTFEVLTPHIELSLTATSLVEVRPRPHPEHPMTWEQLELQSASSPPARRARAGVPARRG